jgi:hypothetical protein
LRARVIEEIVTGASPQKADPRRCAYTNQALRQDLLRVRTAWEDCQASRKRDAIYRYLTAVFNLVAWWAAESRALERAHKALRLQSICPFDSEEPFGRVCVPKTQIRTYR